MGADPLGSPGRGLVGSSSREGLVPRSSGKAGVDADPLDSPARDPVRPDSLGKGQGKAGVGTDPLDPFGRGLAGLDLGRREKLGPLGGGGPLSRDPSASGADLVPRPSGKASLAADPLGASPPSGRGLLGPDPLGLRSGGGRFCLPLHPKPLASPPGPRGQRGLAPRGSGPGRTGTGGSGKRYRPLPPQGPVFRKGICASPPRAGHRHQASSPR